MTIHGEPFPWRKKVSFVGPRLDFEGSLYDDYGLIEPPINFELDDRVAQRAEELMRDMYEKTVSLLRRHYAALVKTVKVCNSLTYFFSYLTVEVCNLLIYFFSFPYHSLIWYWWLECF